AGIAEGRIAGSDNAGFDSESSRRSRSFGGKGERRLAVAGDYAGRNSDAGGVDSLGQCGEGGLGRVQRDRLRGAAADLDGDGTGERGVEVIRHRGERAVGVLRVQAVE